PATRRRKRCARSRSSPTTTCISPASGPMTSCSKMAGASTCSSSRTRNCGGGRSRSWPTGGARDPPVGSVRTLFQKMGSSRRGRRAVFEAGGKISSVPAEHGVIRQLTERNDVAERFPAWSPDGKWIAYFSDRSGEYELTLRPADGKGPEQTLTQFGPGFRYA